MTNEEINNLTDEIVNKGLAEFMEIAPVDRFLISSDGGNSLAIEFDCYFEAHIYLRDKHENNLMSNFEVINKKEYPKYTQSLDRQIPVWGKYKKAATEKKYQT